MKTIIISGGSDGLGFAVAKRLSKCNNLYILARSEKKLKDAASQLNCKYKVCDVTQWNDVQKTINEILKESKTIDILINNAGVWLQGPIEENTPEKIKEVIEINTLGNIYLTKAVVPTMKANKSGIIFNTVSQAGITASAERAVYYASKWAVNGFAKSLYLELIKHNIKVISFFPGGMNTDFFDKAGNKKDRSKMLNIDAVAKTVEFVVTQEGTYVHPEISMVSTIY